MGSILFVEFTLEYPISILLDISASDSGSCISYGLRYRYIYQVNFLVLSTFLVDVYRLYSSHIGQI